MFFRYLKYLIVHKWYVFVECVKRGIGWQGLVHDLSKFRPDEFIPYMRYFYGVYPTRAEAHIQYPYGDVLNREQVDADFDLAWLKHQHRNPHHPQYWVLREDEGKTNILDMPMKYRVEMLCDWIGAGKALGKPDILAWYAAKGKNHPLNPNTREWIEAQLRYEE